MTSRRMPTQVVLHLGAHKTATTHLQQSIAAAGRRATYAFLGPRSLRDKGQTLPERFGFPQGPGKKAPARKNVSDVLADLSGGAPRLVLSEENFAGPLQVGWGRIPVPLYNAAPARVAALAAVIKDSGGPLLDLCLGIRDPASYLTSCYSQILHGRRVVRPDKFRDKNILEIVDWVDYVARLRAVPGVGTLSIWRFEDYPVLFPQICGVLVGDDQIAPLEGRSQQRLSVRAMEAILLAKSLDVPNVVAGAAAAYPVSDTSPAFELYDDAARARSARLYAAQCDRLNACAGVTLLRPGNA